MGERGPAPWEPTDAERRAIKHYVTLGYTQEQIGALIGKSADSLQRYCRHELDTGALEVNAQIGGKLFQKAMQGDTAALIFWAKTRLGWKETVRNELSGVDELVDKLAERRARVNKLNGGGDGD